MTTLDCAHRSAVDCFDEEHDTLPLSTLGRNTPAKPQTSFDDDRQGEVVVPKMTWPERGLVSVLLSIITAASATALYDRIGPEGVHAAGERFAALIDEVRVRRGDASTEKVIDDASAPPVVRMQTETSARAGALPRRPLHATGEQAQPIEEHAVQAALPEPRPRTAAGVEKSVGADEKRAHEKPARDESTARARRSARRRKPRVAPAADDARAVAARSAARSHYAARRYGQAAVAYEKAVRHEPKSALTYVGLGAARLHLGDTQGALRAYERAQQLSPRMPAIHTALGTAYLRAGDQSRAKASFRKALALDPDNLTAQAALSRL